MSTTEFEARLRAALHPVEPPEDLSLRLERTLVELRELATDELEAWELSAMRDPRNWARPAAAAGVALRRPTCSTLPSAQCGISRTRRVGCCPDGHLLPPSDARDGRLLLELRPAD